MHLGVMITVRIALMVMVAAVALFHQNPAAVANDHYHRYYAKSLDRPTLFAR